MAPRKLTLIGIAALMLALPACTRSVSTPPPSAAGTGTAAVVTPNATDDPLAILAQGATQTAMATAGIVLPTPTLAGGTPVSGTPLATQGGVVLPSITPVGGGTPVPTFVYTPAPKPAEYTLKAGEFPYCIARRYNLNPQELLDLNGISTSSGSLYQPGLTLTIPQSSLTFPGETALIPHPATYTVLSGDTVYSVACKYGDPDPLAIAAANGLQSPYTLTVGQVIQVP